MSFFGKSEDGAEVNIPLPEPLARLIAHIKERVFYPKTVTRIKRGPLLLKCHKVVYDPKANGLRLAEGVFVGDEVHRDTKEEDNKEKEYENTVIGGKENDLAGTAIFGETMDYSDCYGSTLKSSDSVPNSLKFFN